MTTPSGSGANTSAAPAVVEPASRNKIPTWAMVGGGVAGVGIIGTLYWYLLFHRKKNKYANSDNDIDFDDDES